MMPVRSNNDVASIRFSAYAVQVEQEQDAETLALVESPIPEQIPER